MSEYKTISSLVLSMLVEGSKPYKDIADEVRLVFPSAITTHKSVASLARDFRKKGLLDPKSKPEVEPEPEVEDEEQLSMIPIFEQADFQLRLI